MIYRVPIENVSGQSYCLDCDACLGDIISHPKEGDDRSDFEIYSVTAILEEYEGREEERREISVNNAQKSSNQTPPPNKRNSPAKSPRKSNLKSAPFPSAGSNAGVMTSEASPDAVKFSTIVGVNKCSAETLERAHEHGIDFDLDTQHHRQT